MLQDEPLERDPVHALLLRDGRADDAERHVRHLRDGAQDRLEPLRGGGPAEREQRQRAPLRPLDALEPGDVDAVADRDELPGAERERALVDAQHLRRDALRRPQQPALAPVREPEEDVHAERPRERRGEHRVDRAHVGEHRRGPGPPRELPGERRLEAQAAARPARGAERPDAAVLGKRALDRAVREHDELVDPCRERPELVDRRPEHGAGRVDLLRDDHEPHPRLASTARPTSSTTRSAYSSAVYVHSAESARPPAPRRSASSRSERSRTSASAISAALPGSTRSPVSPSWTTSGNPAGPRADDGAAAAEGLEHDPRRPLGARGEKQEPGLVERLHDVRRLEPRLPRDLLREARERESSATSR